MSTGPMALPGMAQGNKPKLTSVLHEGKKPHNLNRKKIKVDGKTLTGRVHQRCAELWGCSHGRMADTFIGVTDLASGTFYLYPMFTMKQGSDDTCTSIFYSDAKSKTQTEHDVAEVRRVYGDDAIVIPYTPDVDGQGHAQACVQSGISESQALGWSIKGNCNHGAKFSIRFVSSRNDDKFKERKNEAPDKEGRDLPRAWAVWVADVLGDELRLKVEIPTTGFIRKTPTFQNSRQPSGRNQSSKYVRFKVPK